MKNTYTSDIKSRPLRNKKGIKINDYQTACYGLKCIEKYEKENGTPAPIEPKFKEWLEEGVKFVESGKGNFTQYKRKTIIRKLDINAIVDNTERKNAELSKKGVFNSKVVLKEEGRA